MNLDEMQQKWAAHDRKLDENLRLNRQILKAAMLSRAESALRRMGLLTALHSLAWLACLGVLGKFIYTHWETPGLALPALLLDLYALVNLIWLASIAVAALRTDYGFSVVELQKHLVQLRIQRLRYLRGAVLAGLAMWTPFVITVLPDAYQTPGTAWLLSNLLLTTASIPLWVWASRRYRQKLANSPFLSNFLRDLAGYNLNAAGKFLQTLADFERQSDAEPSAGKS